MFESGPSGVITFWFEEAKPENWWKSTPQFDRLLKERFSDLHAAASRCELFLWRKSATGRLAEVVVLDQFSRHIFRGTPAAFAQDPLALALAQEAVRAGAAKQLDSARKAFLYMPFMHSESARIHEVAVELFAEQGLEKHLDYELRHKAIIDRFGRYPHRNAILGRKSTPEESEFLKQPGSSF